jgi:hypothetical protein
LLFLFLGNCYFEGSVHLFSRVAYRISKVNIYIPSVKYFNLILSIDLGFFFVNTNLNFNFGFVFSLSLERDFTFGMQLPSILFFGMQSPLILIILFYLWDAIIFDFINLWSLGCNYLLILMLFYLWNAPSILSTFDLWEVITFWS